jgi:hypothetical protein
MSRTFHATKGKRGSDTTMRLTNTIPASKSRMKSSRSAGSFVHALAPRPNGLRLAPAASRARNMHATGPHSSAQSRAAPAGISVSTAMAGSGTQALPVGLDPNHIVVFEFEYPTSGCETAWNSRPIPLAGPKIDRQAARNFCEPPGKAPSPSPDSDLRKRQISG